MRKGLKYGHRYFLGAITLAIAATGFFNLGFSKTYSGKSTLSYMQQGGGELSSLKRANAWLNTQPLTASDLKGKVVLIEFGTYTCINWIRTLPYIRAWAEKYKAKGLEVIVVHTPEFPFEKNIDNVSRAIKDMKIDFPIAVDNKQDIWNAFSNQYWPALYFIDAKGRIRHYQFGEGEYEKSEKIIQQLLIEAGANEIDDGLVTVKAEGVEVAADWNSLNSPENYLGYEHTENFAGSGLMHGEPHVYLTPSHLRLNHWSLSGDWTVGNQSIILNKVNGRIMYRFQARDLHLVMGPAVPGISVRFRVRIDGRPPGNAHGTDVDEQGNGTITEQRLYQLIRQPMPVSDHEFEIEFFHPGAEAFTFTFG